MDADWLEKTLHDFSDKIDSCEAKWRQADLFFEDSEDIWFDSRAVQFRQHYLNEISRESVTLLNDLQMKNESLANALSKVKEAEDHRAKLLTKFEGFIQACVEENESIALTESNIRDAENEIDVAQRSMEEAKGILRKIRQ